MERKQRIICIGDVHGCLDELKQLIEKVNYDQNYDRLILVGDLVDRGLYSIETVSYVQENGFECVAGNHDNKFVRYNHHEIKKVEAHKHGKTYKNPMRLSAEKKETYNALSKSNLKWLSSLPDFIFCEDENLLIVHAGVQPGLDPLGQKGNVYRHCRYVDNETYNLVNLDTSTYTQPYGTSHWSDLYDGTINIVYGHQVFDKEKPYETENFNGAKTFGIDTGCCFGGNLTALIFEDDGRSFHYEQVKAAKKYYGF